MYKEIIICIIIIIVIFSLDFITQRYTEKVINEIIFELENLREELMKEEETIILNDLTNKCNDLYNEWMKYHSKLAFYIEHDELEKAETNFVACKSFIQNQKYADSVCELDKTIFILEHIVDKNKFSIENIF